MGQGDDTMSEVREAVRSRYANVAKQFVVFNETGSGPDGCCQADGPDCGCSGSYSAEALREIGLTESVSLGCGNPTMLAELKPGETVLDLGSGAGLDVLLSARRVSPGGHAYGVDMTDEMLSLAHGNREKAAGLRLRRLTGQRPTRPAGWSRLGTRARPRPPWPARGPRAARRRARPRSRRARCPR